MSEFRNIPFEILLGAYGVLIIFLLFLSIWLLASALHEDFTEWKRRRNEK